MHKGFKCLDISIGHIYISRGVIFDESIFPFVRLELAITQMSYSRLPQFQGMMFLLMRLMFLLLLFCLSLIPASPAPSILGLQADLPRLLRHAPMGPAASAPTGPAASSSVSPANSPDRPHALTMPIIGASSPIMPETSCAHPSTLIDADNASMPASSKPAGVSPLDSAPGSSAPLVPSPRRT
jgi:hypothetical protein